MCLLNGGGIEESLQITLNTAGGESLNGSGPLSVVVVEQINSKQDQEVVLHGVPGRLLVVQSPGVVLDGAEVNIRGLGGIDGGSHCT